MYRGPGEAPEPRRDFGAVLCAVSGEAVSSVGSERGPRLIKQSQHQRLQTATEWHGVHHETFVHVPGFFFFFCQSFVFFFASLHWTVVVHTHHVLFSVFMCAFRHKIRICLAHMPHTRYNIFVRIIWCVAEWTWMFKIEGSSLGGVTPWEGCVAASARGLIDFLMISGQAPSPC